MLASHFFIIATVVISVVAQIFLKSGITQIGVFPILSFNVFIPFLAHILTSPYILAGLLLYAISTFLWLALLSRLDLSYLYPFGALQYVLVILFSHLYLKEVLNPGRIGGISLILVGIIIIQKFSSKNTV